LPYRFLGVSLQLFNSIREDEMSNTKRIIAILNFSFLLCFVLHSTVYSQIFKKTSHFPMEINNRWMFSSLSDTLVETIVDTQRIGDNIYFLFDKFRDLSGYLFRMFESKVYVYADTAEYVWYDFSADSGESWIVPPLVHPYYGGTFTLESKVDTIVTPAGNVTDCFRIHHFIGADFEFVEWFANDIGIVQRDVITFAGLRRWVLMELVTSVFDDNEPNATTYLLSQNFPNPFNPKTKISYSVTDLSYIWLKVFDVLGSEIATLVNEEKPAGSYEVKFDASDLTSGIFFYRIQVYPANGRAGSFVETKKMILIK
jgi:hypothetical protein